jgi:hypothetical protein
LAVQLAAYGVAGWLFFPTTALLALTLIRDVFQYTCGVGQGKSLVFEQNPSSRMINN